MANAGREPWTWSPARVEALEKAIESGQSAGQFERSTGGQCTRNAAIGKARRMGLSFRGDVDNLHGMRRARERRSLRPAHEARRPSPAQAKAPPRDRSNLDPPPLPELRVVQTEGRFVGLLQRADHGECKYIVNDPEQGAGAIYCAAVTGDGLPYCPGHMTICYRPAIARKQRGPMRKYFA